MFNQLTNLTMSKKEVIALRVMQTWTVCLAGVLIVGLAVTIFNLLIGNYHGTACREF